MASREQKPTNRYSLSLSLLSPKRKKSSTPNRTLYISRPLNAFGPTGQNLGIHPDDVVLPLRVYCEIFGPSVNYKSVGVTQTTTAVQIIQNLFQKMNRVGECSLTEYCLVEMCILIEFAYLRLLDYAANPLLLYQQHSKRYKSSDNWKLKLILKSQLKANASIMLNSFKSILIRDCSLVCVSVNCRCLEDSFLSVCFLLPPSAKCEKIINKIVTEFANIRQPDDLSLHFPALNGGSNDQLPNSITLDCLQKLSGTGVIELILRNKYEDIADEYDLSDTENTEVQGSSGDYPKPKYSDQSIESDEVWVEFYDSTREKVYYINSNTEEIIWVHPSTQQEMYLDSDMPPGWVRGVDRESGRVFYQNTFDKKIEWSHPLRHLHRIYKQSLQPVSNTSLPRPTPSNHKPPARCPPPPPVPLSARPTLVPLQPHQPSHLLSHKYSHSLNSSKQSVSDEVERTSSDAVLTEFNSVSNRHKAQRKNKRLSNLRRLLVNEKYSDDSDTGSGHKIKSLFAPTNRKKQTEGTSMPGISVTVTPDPSPVGRKKSIVSVASSASGKSFPTNTLSSLPRNFPALMSTQVNNPGFPAEHERSNSYDCPELPEERAVIHTQQNVTEQSAYARSVSEVEQQKHTAATALDEAFSLLDGNRPPGSDVDSFRRGTDSGEVIVNKNAHFTRGEEIADNSLNHCFEVIGDSSFDEGSDQDMFYPTKEYTVVVESCDTMERNSYTTEGPLVSDISVANKISLFEQKLYEDSAVGQDMNALLSVPLETGEGLEPRERSGSVGSVSSDTGSLRSEDTGSLEGGTGGRTKNALRTRKGRMSRNTSALNHQELELLNKGGEPQKSILKHSRSDTEANSDKKYKGVSFLSSSVQMIEIDRRRGSPSHLSPELNTQSVIHRRGVSNWRDMLKDFYGEVDRQGGVSDLVWSPDEGIGLVEEERFIKEANRLTVNQEFSHESVPESTEEDIINSLKESLQAPPPLIMDSQPPKLPPRPTPDDIDNISNSDSSRPSSTPKAPHESLDDIAETRDEDILAATDTMIRDVSGIMNNIISLADDAANSMHKNKIATEQQIDRSNRAFIDSYICPSNDTVLTNDSSGVTDSGMFSLEVSTNLDEMSPCREEKSKSLSLTQLVFETLSGTLANSTSNREPFTSLSMVQKESPSRVKPTIKPTEEPVVVSSLVEPVTPNAMIPMNVFLPKERPTLLREQIIKTPILNLDSPRDDIASLSNPGPSPVPILSSEPHKHLQALSKTRSASPVLVDQLNKPLSGTPFIYGYQFQRKPANKSTTLHSGYLALVEQQTSEYKQRSKKYSN